MEFPRLVYKSASSHVLVEDTKEYDEKLKEGWFASVVEAIEGKKPEAAKEIPKDNAPPTREELEFKANELGIKFDGRTKDAKLLALISEKV